MPSDDVASVGRYKHGQRIAWPGVTKIRSVGIKLNAPLLLYGPVFAVALGAGAILPLIPSVLDDLHRSGVPNRYSLHAGILVALYVAASGLAAPWWGRRVDREGPKRALIVGLIGYAIALAVLMSTSALLLVYAARFAAGVFAGALLPATVVAVTQRFEQPDRAQYIGWISTSSITGALIGPALTGTLNQLAGQWTLSPYAPIWITVVITILCAASVAMFSHARRSEANSAHATVERGALLNVVIITVIAAMAHGALEVGMSIYARSRFEAATVKLSWIFAVCSLSMIVWQWWVLPILVRRIALHLRVQIGFIAVAIGFLLAARAPSFVALTGLVTLVSFALGTILGSMTLATTRLGDVLGVGATFGKQASASAIGQGLGSLIAGIAFTRLSRPLEMLALGTLLAAVYALRLRQRHEQTTQDVIGY